MNLPELLQPWIPDGVPNVKIVGMKNDSRQVQAQDLFIAYLGAVSDGRKYIAQAVSRGAAAIVYDPQNLPLDVHLPAHIPCLPIPNLASQLAKLASRFYDSPSKKLDIMGVTGTNGKTTIAYQLTQAHQLLGKKAAYIGTLGQGLLGHFQPLPNTTPDALCLQHLLSTYLQQGIQQICMEVSSHALSTQRVDEINFQEAIYTNLSHEHLDYHKTMAEYAKAKAILFAKPGLEWIILNQDDEYVVNMAASANANVQKFTYGIQNKAEIRGRDCQLFLHGSTYQIESPWGNRLIQIPSLGLFNIYNSLAVFTSLLAHGYDLDAVVAVMANLQSSPGRMEIVSHQPYVIVDYAHTPAALENVLKTIVNLKQDQNKVWVVFGCGGDRDKTKRPLMGKLAAEYGSEVILTNDNPRHEDPQAIIQDIKTGLSKTAAVNTILDRSAAIQFALNAAGKEDIVLIAGKGHENYQIIGDQRLHFSDQEEVRKVLSNP